MSLLSLLVQILRRFLRFRKSIHWKSLRPISHLFVFLGFLRRHIARKLISIGIAIPDQHSLSACCRAALDSGEKAICSMNIPPSVSSIPSEGDRHSPVDMPYGSASGGGHLVPNSSTARRQFTNHISWINGSETSLHVESSSMRPESTHADNDSILQPHSSIAANAFDDHRAQSPDSLTHACHPSDPSHQIITFASNTAGDSEVHAPSHRSAYIYPGAIDQELHRTTSQLSFSSQKSTSRRSNHSGISVGRDSYREYHGPAVSLRRPAPVVRSGFDMKTPSSHTLHGEATAVNNPIVDPEHISITPSTNSHSQSAEEEVTQSVFRFAPMSTNGVFRYQRMMRDPGEVDNKIEGMMFKYPGTPDIPDGWTAHRHPEGALYFMHAESKTFTEVNICNPDILQDIEDFRDFLFSVLRSEIDERNLSESLDPSEIQLVLEPQRISQGFVCCYYFVNPSSRTLFWLDNWEAPEILGDCRGSLSLPHKGLGIQAHYWRHWDLFPNLCAITEQLKNEVVGMILHATCDHLTSNQSSCPLNSEELTKHLSLVKEINPCSMEMQQHSAIVIGRIMHIFYWNRFLNFHGEDCARLNFDQSVHGWRYHPSILMSTFAPLLFMEPVNKVRLLHRIFVDDIASKSTWNAFIVKLNGHLQETSVLATVLLNANVGFLPKQSGTGTSPQQYLSYMSLVSSMASIILALVFMGYNRTDARNTPFEAAKFLDALRHERHGLETLAVVYSLPHALLMWGMILFLAAFVVQWWISGNTVSHASVGSVFIGVALLVGWAIWIARDRSHFWWFQPNPNETELENTEHDKDMVPFLLGLKRSFRDLINRCGVMMYWRRKQTASPPTAGSHEMREGLGNPSQDLPGSHPLPLVTLS